VGIIGARAELLLSLLLAIEKREFLVFTGKEADEVQPPDLFCREQFIVWHTRACSKLSLDVTEPFKFSAYHCFSFGMGCFEYKVGRLRSSKRNNLNSPKTISTMFKHDLNGNYVSCSHKGHLT
jgi:hypothetical protein